MFIFNNNCNWSQSGNNNAAVSHDTITDLFPIICFLRPAGFYIVLTFELVVQVLKYNPYELDES